MLWIGRFAVLALTIAASLMPLGPARAEPVVTVPGGTASVALLPRAELVDPDGTLSPSEALARLESPDATVESRVYSRGFIRDVVWARVVLEVTPEAAGRWYFTLELPNFDRLQVFAVPSDGSGQPVKPLFALGDRVPTVTDIRTRFHLAPMDLSAGRTVLLVRGRTNSTMTLALRLWKLDALLLQEQEFYALQAFYVGIAAVLFLGAVGLFVFSRQLVYIVYMVNLVAHCGIWLMANGTGPGYLWPGLAASYPFELHAFLALSGTGTYAFAAMFLSTVRVPRLVPISFWAMAGFSALLTVLCLVVPAQYAVWSNWLVTQVTLPFSVFMLVPMAAAFLANEPAVRPLFVTWVALSLAVGVGVARNAGLLPNNVLTLTGPQLGSVVEMIVFAYMLVSRLGRVQHEKDALQQAALAAAREYERELEQRVADRTAELDAAVERERNARRLQQQFVAMVSHEFRTPLAIVDAAAQNFVTGDAGDQGRLGKIRAAVRRLRRMIDTCLIDERVEGGRLHLQTDVTELGGMIEDTVEVLKAAPGDRRFRLDLPDEPVTATVDARLMAVAVNNLMENAVKYSPPGSTVDVALSVAPAGIRIAVTDQGPGIPASERDRVFDRYYRLDSAASTSGAGLGLFLVRSIVEAHGGQVTCEAGPGGGSRFLIDLPAADAGMRSVA